MEQRIRIASWVLAGIALTAVLMLHLLPGLLAGLLVYELVHILAPRLRVVRVRQEQGKLVAVAILITFVLAAIVAMVIGAIAFFRSEAGSLPALLGRMADIIDRWRGVLPASWLTYLPGDLDQLREQIVEALRSHAGELQRVGAEAGRIAAHVIIGLGIGALAALHEQQRGAVDGPLARALRARLSRLANAFRLVVFAQVRISAINTALTALYLAVVLPLLGIHVPLTKTMIAITFVVGLLPVVGNLISNTIIVVLSLSVSFSVAVASLVFLVTVHKLEYFLNAQIVGTHVHARAWELLLAMVVMEAAFGMPGLVAAPIYYAYVKDELVAQQLV